MEQIIKGLSVQKNSNKFSVLFLHYTADPEKTIEWANNLKISYPSEDLWNQEMELDFTKTTGRRVFPNFSRELHISKLLSIPNKEILRGWDFGYGHPACVFAQLTPEKRLHVLYELMGTDETIYEFAPKVLEISEKKFHGFKFKDAGDPAVRAKSDKSERTTADILRAEFDIKIQSRFSSVKDGINLIRKLLIPRQDGFGAFKIDEGCLDLIDGFLGGYIQDENDNPIKDKYYEHLFDALRYLIIILFNMKTAEPFVYMPAFSIKRATADKTTGY